MFNIELKSVTVEETGPRRIKYHYATAILDCVKYHVKLVMINVLPN